MQVLSAPNERFHYRDEGPSEESVVLMLHVEPLWSYQYRKMMPGVVAAGHRAVAPHRKHVKGGDRILIRVRRAEEVSSLSAGFTGREAVQ